MTRRHDPADLSGAAQEYLLALRVMAGIDGLSRVTAAQVGRHLGVFTPQAASEMFRRLAADDRSSRHGSRELVLTTAGRAAADAIFHRHALLEWLLTAVVGLGWAELDEEAARLQGAHLAAGRGAPLLDAGPSADVPPRQPDGRGDRPSPTCRRAVSAPSTPDLHATIYRITEEAEEDATPSCRTSRRAALTPGVPVTVLARSESLDSLTLEGPRGRATLGLRPARLVRVLIGDADPSPLPPRAAAHRALRRPEPGRPTPVLHAVHRFGP